MKVFYNLFFISYSQSFKPTGGKLFHHKDPLIRQSLKNSIKGIGLFCDHPRSPLSAVTVGFHVAHDPSMPTLSPQQPASLQNIVLNSGDKIVSEPVNTNSNNNTKGDSINQVNTVNNPPPSLVSKSEPTALSSMSPIISSTTSVSLLL